jgi:hypothetical protein
MQRITFRLAIALITFIIGVATASLWFFSRQSFSNRIKVSDDTSAVPAKWERTIVSGMAGEVISRDGHPTSFVDDVDSDGIRQALVPKGWRKIDAGGRFAFYLPKSMKLIGNKRCEECGWSGQFSDWRISLHAESSSWNGGYAAWYLAKQKEYAKELTEIDGRKAKIESWRSEEAPKGFNYFTEVRFYGADGKLAARFEAWCKGRHGVEAAKQIFRTVDFP